MARHQISDTEMWAYLSDENHTSIEEVKKDYIVDMLKQR